jgi:hypothetical protein
MVDTKVEIINQACSIIRQNLGETTAEMYKKFYETKGEHEILLSVQELLIEIVGPVNADTQLKPLFNQFSSFINE